MNFFQSVFSDDPEPDPQSPQNPNPNPNPNPSIQSITSAWTFSSSLLQTLASKSESVLQTYRHDLQEFTSGLKKETDVIREKADVILEAGVESLESVGEAVENLGNTVTSILTVNYIDNNDHINDSHDNTSEPPFSRVDALIRTARGDAKTYLNDPEDLGEFNEWKLGFGVEALKGEIEEVMNADGGVVREIFEEVVPGGVDEVTFWERYFYKVWKIRKVEEARVRLVKRAVSGEDDDEELSWDVDEDEYEDEEKETVGNVVVSEVKNEDKDELEVKPDVKVGLGLGLGSEGKTTDRDSDISIVSTQPSPEEDGWDEIEDIGSSDENKDKGVARGSPDRAELRKRLSVAEDDEDLTWDIEDDDDDDKPVKA